MFFYGLPGDLPFEIKLLQDFSEINSLTLSKKDWATNIASVVLTMFFIISPGNLVLYVAWSKSSKTLYIYKLLNLRKLSQNVDSVGFESFSMVWSIVLVAFKIVVVKNINILK